MGNRHEQPKTIGVNVLQLNSRKEHKMLQCNNFLADKLWGVFISRYNFSKYSMLKRFRTFKA